MDSSLVWSPAQQRRLDDFGVPRCVDVHCHCLPELDDGPETMDEALALCRALVADGITSVVATPHQLGRYEDFNSTDVIREKAAEVRAALAAHGISLEISTAGDVRVDERLPDLLAAGVVSTIGDSGRHVLLELPHEVFVDPLPLIGRLGESGIQAIMTHPERHRYLDGPFDRFARWIDCGAVLQITAGSLTGDFGRRAFDQAWRLIEAGLVSIVATDAHDAINRRPCLTTAIDSLVGAVGREVARMICLENPLQIWEGRRVGQPN
jgi:protein-tyrosine phosphatase